MGSSKKSTKIAVKAVTKKLTTWDEIFFKRVAEIQGS